ncbi:hypothetical protein ACFX2K_044688 [Malus domestica]
MLLASQNQNTRSSEEGNQRPEVEQVLSSDQTETSASSESTTTGESLTLPISFSCSPVSYFFFQRQISCVLAIWGLNSSLLQFGTGEGTFIAPTFS